jgi:hypothetical protein
MNWHPSAELAEGLKQGLLLGTAVLVLVLPLSSQDRALSRQPLAANASFGTTPAPAQVRRLVDWVVSSRDNGNRPFAVVDKRGAYLYVFDARAHLLADSAVLLGSAIGDDSVPGIGQRAIDAVRPGERTTPAGRFQAQPGTDSEHEKVVWIDYGGAVAMHRVLLSNPAEHRLQRLASPSPSQRRISYGCVNLPVAFFDDVLWPTIGARRGVVYVLPEVKTLSEVFPALAHGPLG